MNRGGRGGRIAAQVEEVEISGSLTPLLPYSPSRERGQGSKAEEPIMVKYTGRG